MQRIQPLSYAAKPARRKRGLGRPDMMSTALVLLGCFLTLILPDGDSYEMAHQAAMIMGIVIAMGLAMELLRDLRNLMRVDLLMLVALYALLYLEFLFPQPEFAYMVSSDLMEQCILVIALGFGGIALGRHWPMRATGLRQLTEIELSPRALIFGIMMCTVLGYLHMLWAVGFNPIRMLDAMMWPRFSQPWGRGRLGGWPDLFHELGLLIYLVPPAVGVVYARRKNFTRGQRLLAYVLLALTMFYGFSGGTRNVFFVYVLGFAGGYFLTAPRMSLLKTTKLFGASAVVLLLASQVMLEFRNIGLKNYLADISSGESSHQAYTPQETFFVDYNIYTLSFLVDHFPERGPYLGLEIPFWTFVKPVPRAIWPGKPEGLSVSIEQIRNEPGGGSTTWSTTFLGEAYMSAGMFGVGLAALLFGIAAAWWNTLLRNDEGVYRKLLYASGLFAAAISMRSMFWLTTAILPTVALIFYGRWFLKRRSRMSQPRKPIQHG